MHPNITIMMPKEKTSSPAENPIFIKGCLIILLSLLVAIPAQAFDLGEISIPVFSMEPGENGSQEYSVTLQILFLMTMFTFIPALLMMMTAFTRILIVFSILRQAIGLQQTPSNQIIIGMTLFITFYVMTPVFERINDYALQPYLNESITSKEALDRAVQPIKSFMLKQTREDDLLLFVRMSGSEVMDRNDVPLTILMPSFLTSELKTAFQIGFLLFIPFLIIDLVVASVLMAMGMMMLSPLIVSLPFKIMLFVFIDGWSLIIGTLANSFGTF